MVTKIGKTAKVKAFIAACSLFVAGQALESHAASPFVQDELLVQHRAGVAAGKMEEVIKGHGASTVGEIPQIRVKRIKVPAGAMESVKAALEKNPFVSFAEPNYFRGVTATPNDSQYPSQWHLSNISAPSGWDLSTGSASYPVAIIDTGVDPSHPDLAGKLVAGWNFVTRTSDTHDVYGHGTKVAGSAAALSNNATGVAGVAWSNPIMPLVVSDSTGSAADADIASAITYAADRGVRVVNISYGGPGASSTLQSAVDYAWNKGVIIFSSAGNYGSSTPNYPAACNHVVAVSATTSSDTLASWSSFGDWVDISAPGASILTTTNGGGYAYASGTSFSSPIAAGLAALVVSVNPTLKNSDVETIIKNNANDLGAAGFDPQFGFGKINVYYTLLAAKAAAPAPDTTAPVASITSPAAGATVMGVAAVNASATDNVGVTKVELYLDGALFATDTVGPFSFTWDTAKVANGSHDLLVVAYDAAGNTGQSAHVTVMVSNIMDTTTPSAAINSPANGATVSGTVTIKATASDNIGVTKMELYIDGALKGTSTSATLSISWNTRKAATGAHTISVKAYDAAGNMGMTSITVFK